MLNRFESFPMPYQLRIFAILLWLSLALAAQNPVTSPYPGAIDTDQTLTVAKNSATSTLSSAITAVATTIPVTNGAAFLVGNIITIGTEKMLVTGIATNNLTVASRSGGFGGGPAVTHPINAVVSVFIESQNFNAVASSTKAIQSALGANLINISPLLFHVLQQSLPTPVTTPVSPTSYEGNVLSYSVLVNSLVIQNIDTVSHTVTVQDCATTPFRLFNAYTIAASTTWTIPLNMSFIACFKWASDSALVYGSATGQKINANGTLPTATQGIGAIDPTVTAGDLIIRGPSGLLRFPPPAAGTWCWNFTSLGVATYANCPTGFGNPMTLAGDLITGGPLGSAVRLPASSGYLHWNGSAFVYDTPTAASAGFGVVTSGSNTAATMTCASGCAMLPSGTGTISANQLNGVTISTLGSGLLKFTGGIPALANPNIDYQSALGFTPENAVNKDTDPALSSNDNVHYASTAALRTYVAAHGGAGSGTSYTSGILDWFFARTAGVLTYGSNCLPATPCNVALGSTRFGFSGGPYTLTLSGANSGAVCSYINTSGALAVAVGGGALVPANIAASGGVTVVASTGGACPADTAIPLQSWTVTAGVFDLTGTALASYLSMKPSLVTTGLGLAITPGTRDSLALDLSAFVGAPATAGAACTQGQWSSASGFAYFCIGTNSWQRVAIAAW
ncbi:MAG: hypothetical protein NVS9B4_01150 [Candidatus Acidiferrum sp.]